MSSLTDNLMNQEFDPEISRRKLIDLRRRVANNEAVPEEEIAEGLLLLRKMFGHEAKAGKKTTAKKAAPKKPAKKVNVDDLLGGLLEDL